MKPRASLSLDLDNQWSYMKTHGDPGWELFPSYLDVLIPRVLRFLKERNLRITFFIVGQDAAIERNSKLLEAIIDAGHEVGNHSFHHEQWFHLSSESEIESEIELSERSIESMTGKHPLGFRGPGFSLSARVLRVLARRGYQYDASRFPTFLGPLSRAYYFRQSRLGPEERKRREQLFGSFKDGFRPLKPYWIEAGARTLVEIPVTTIPLLKVPFHVSYLLYLSIRSAVLSESYFRFALQMCRWAKTEPSLLLHPLDFLGCDDTQAISFFPGMRLKSTDKLKRVGKYVDLYREHFEVMTLEQHAQSLMQEGKLMVKESV